MDERLLFTLIGFIPSLIPAVLLYLQKRKEISTSEPREIMTAQAAAEAGMRADLNTQIAGLREENKELKQEIKELKKENKSLELRIIELERQSLNVKHAWQDDFDRNKSEGPKE